MPVSPEEIEILAEDIVDDVELSRISLAAVMLKCARLARWLEDDNLRRTFAYEAGGYPSSSTGVPPDAFELARVVGRTYDDKNKDGSIGERMNVKSVDVWEQRIATNKVALAAAADRDVSLSSANPNQLVFAPMSNSLERKRLADEVAEDAKNLARSRTFAYEFATATLYQIKFSKAAKTIFDRVRQRLDIEIINIAPRAAEKVLAIQDNLSSENPEDWANGVHSCRRLLQEVADAIFPPAGPQERNGRTVNLGPDNYINRLVCYIEDHSQSVRYNAIVGSSLKHIGERLDALFQAAQKGSHANINSKEEAERYVIYTFLTLSDILSLSAE